MKTEARFKHNPEHPIGTCAECGAEMVYNVPRLGPNGGFVHKLTGSFGCPHSPEHGQQPVSPETRISPFATSEAYWKEIIETEVRLAMCIGALKMLKFQVDTAASKRIDELLLLVEKPPKSANK